ncbi:MAG: hypothetical protein A2527_09495 [Candidatus Lambdaproteobacteria bacterium RIFOXYD2_FULL_50_16]|uniref:Uncharacterized protein n=1 Tax=Candidatus Lambdaproteobacteria bacterium RIFOXYD2_FULL_50_16 TaxID=1817772 RepID=A0A1F6G7I3_9PROT|nr:MAG: hypothetical protein A2527_09495 [Candidatus Lambdaproteobacteria bacterium RIFOXYD2_FULL_50_16]
MPKTVALTLPTQPDLVQAPPLPSVPTLFEGLCTCWGRKSWLVLTLLIFGGSLPALAYPTDWVQVAQAEAPVEAVSTEENPALEPTSEEQAITPAAENAESGAMAIEPVEPESSQGVELQADPAPGAESEPTLEAEPSTTPDATDEASNPELPNSAPESDPEAEEATSEEFVDDPAQAQVIATLPQRLGIIYYDQSIKTNYPDPLKAFTAPREQAVFAAAEDPDGRMSLTFINCHGFLQARQAGMNPQTALDQQVLSAYGDCLLLWALSRAKAPEVGLPDLHLGEFLLKDLDVSPLPRFHAAGLDHLEQWAQETGGSAKSHAEGLELASGEQKFALRLLVNADFTGDGRADLLAEAQWPDGGREYWLIEFHEPLPQGPPTPHRLWPLAEFEAQNSR